MADHDGVTKGKEKYTRMEKKGEGGGEKRQADGGLIFETRIYYSQHYSSRKIVLYMGANPIYSPTMDPRKTPGRLAATMHQLMGILIKL